LKNYETIVKKIMRVFLCNTHYLTLDNLAQNVGISKRSVQNYLAVVDSWIEQNGLLHTKVIRKRGQGIVLGTDVTDRLKIEKLLHGESLSIYDDDNKRRFNIIKKLIIIKEQTTVRSLSEQFYVSRSIIQSDLEWVKQWLLEYKLEVTLTQRGGIEVKGDEVLHRNAIAGYIDSYRLIADVDAMVFRRRNILFEGILNNLTGIYPEETVQKIRMIIESSEQKFSFFLTDDYFTSLLTHITIGVSRLLSGNTVSEEFYPPDDEEFPPFVVETAEYISQCLESVFNISVSNIERTYISIHLVGFNAISPDDSTNVKIQKKIKNLGTMMLAAIDSQLGTAFMNDESLYFDLCLHLKATVFRLQKDIYHKKTSKFQLSDSDAYLYDAVVKASRFYWEICGVVPDEEELLNVTCYLLLSIRRKKRKPKALLICNDGITKRMELMDFIGAQLPSIDVTDCCTVYQYKNIRNNDFDFIISTENIQSPVKPMVELSSIDRSEYSDFIASFLENNLNIPKSLQVAVHGQPINTGLSMPTQEHPW